MMPHLVLARAARAGMTTSSPSLLASTSSDLSGGKQLIKGRGGWVEGRGGGGGGGGGEEEEEEKVRRLGHLETSSRALSKKPWSLSLVETRRCTWRRGGGGGGEEEGRRRPLGTVVSSHSTLALCSPSVCGDSSALLLCKYNYLQLHFRRQP